MSLVVLFTDVKSVLKCLDKAETVDCILLRLSSLISQGRGDPWMGRLSECTCHRVDILHYRGGGEPRNKDRQER